MGPMGGIRHGWDPLLNSCRRTCPSVAGWSVPGMNETARNGLYAGDLNLPIQHELTRGQ